ncbi:MAG TPA: metallophosphoesterase family protein [Alphaproteobacteria bacterium]
MRTPPAAPAGTRIYAIGDIHGRADLLGELYRLIAADAAAVRGAGRRVVVHIGDYIDRGPDSRGVIELCLAHPLAGFLPVYLKGNHEQMMLDYLDGRNDGRLWVMNGGGETLTSYGIDPETTLGPPVRAALTSALPEGHRAFLDHLALSARFGDYLFVHAGIDPERAIDDQDEDDMIWIRQPFLSSTTDFGCVVVHGHTITRAPAVRANRIGIDTGAFGSGVLTALVLDGADRAFLHTGR